MRRRFECSIERRHSESKPEVSASQTLTETAVRCEPTPQAIVHQQSGLQTRTYKILAIVHDSYNVLGFDVKKHRL